MATDWAVSDIKIKNIPVFLEKAERLRPTLIRTACAPVRFGLMVQGTVIYDSDITDFSNRELQKGDVVVLDFGEHMAGYFSFECNSVGSPQDAPAFLKLTFCEIERELFADTQEYSGWLSRGWFQEEWLHFDTLPKRMEMERRYACRFIKIEVLDTSPKYRLVINHPVFVKESAVDMGQVPIVGVPDSVEAAIDEASLRTLQNCMQEVFEDGPKRDRRLWLGDLRLQAKVNAVTYQQYDLVKRCLYMFAGQTREDGMVAACIFHKPKLKMDDTFLLDYSLFFIEALLDYFDHTEDEETLRELYPTALCQLELAKQYRDEQGIFPGEGKYHCFIDWNEELDKQCAMQAVFVFSIKQAAELAVRYRDGPKADELFKMYQKERNCAWRKFWDEEKCLFVSGEERQVSWASQVWMILAGVIDSEQGAGVLERMGANAVSMVTPYMYHHYIEALRMCGEKERAMEAIKNYWGGMIEQGADTFWELYNPQNPMESPYGSPLVNSYCHAWSCTPAYFFRRL